MASLQSESSLLEVQIEPVKISASHPIHADSLASVQYSGVNPRVFVQKRNAVLHDTRTRSKLRVTRTQRKLSVVERKAVSKLPLEILAREWFDRQEASIGMRYYLVENLLPTLVIALEKLLIEVTQRNLAENTEQQEDFNPINFVAQYLMRNNPRYSNFPEAHPYCRTMKQVAEELKELAYSMQSEKLAELKAQSVSRCLAREEEEALKRAEEMGKVDLMQTACSKWIPPGENSIFVDDVRYMMQSLLLMMDKGPVKSLLQTSFMPLLSETKNLVWKESDLVNTLMECAKGLFDNEFYQLVEHIGMCGTEKEYRRLRNNRRDIVASVFDSCDPDSTNAIDRIQMLYLLACYYDLLPHHQQETFYNPIQWPILDMWDVEELEEKIDLQKNVVMLSSLSKQDLQEFLEEPVDSIEEDEQTSTSKDGEEKILEDESAMMEVEGRSDAVGVETAVNKDGGVKSTVDSDRVVEGTKGHEEEESGTEGVMEIVKGEGMKDEIEGAKSEGIDEEDTKDEGVKSAQDSVEGSEEKVEGESEKVEGDSEEKKVENKDKVGGESETKVEGESEEKNAVSWADEISKDTNNKVTNVQSDKKEMSLSTFLKQKLSSRGKYTIYSYPVIPSGPGAMWVHQQLNKMQFVELVDLFMRGDDRILQSFVQYIRKNYTLTAEVRNKFLNDAQQHARLTTKWRQINLLFDEWDTNHSGYLQVKTVQSVLAKWEDFSTEDAKQQAVDLLNLLDLHHDQLTCSQFQTYIDILTYKMKPEKFAVFVDFLSNNMESTAEEQRHSKRRKGLLNKLICTGKLSNNYIPTMKEAISIIHQDIEELGDLKQVTVTISLCEFSDGFTSLCIKAASPSIEHRVIGKKLLRIYKEGVGFEVVDTAEPVHVTNIQEHGKVHFLIPEHDNEEYNGSLVVLPITTPQQVVVGTISVDTLQPIQSLLPEDKTALKSVSANALQLTQSSDQATVGSVSADTFQLECSPEESLPITNFQAHEISFFQGVGLCLGEICHWVAARQNLLTVAQSGLAWIHKCCPAVLKGEVYIVHPCPVEQVKQAKSEDYHLCLMLSTTPSQLLASNINKDLKRNDNLFLEYLFECVDSSAPLLYKECNLAFPVRDHTGCAVAVVNLNMSSQQSLSHPQLKEVVRVQRLLDVAFHQLSFISGKKKQHPTHEGEEEEHGTMLQERETLYNDFFDQTADVGVLFEHLMFTDVKRKLKKADVKAFAKLRAPPLPLLRVVQALLYILYPDQELTTWLQCQQLITVSLVKTLDAYDPLKVSSHPKLSTIRESIDIPMSSVDEHGYLLLKYIYIWVYNCVSLLNYSVFLSDQQSTTHHHQKSSVSCYPYLPTISELPQSPPTYPL